MRKELRRWWRQLQRQFKFLRRLALDSGPGQLSQISNVLLQLFWDVLDALSFFFLSFFKHANPQSG